MSAVQLVTVNPITQIWAIAKERQLEITGLSWSGFNLVGDQASIEEVKRLQFEVERLRAILAAKEALA